MPNNDGRELVWIAGNQKQGGIAQRLTPEQREARAALNSSDPTLNDPTVEILILQMGDDRYEDTVGRLRADRELRHEMWQAAESRLDEHPDKIWVIAHRLGEGALAWCAYEPSTEPGYELKLVNSYERPWSWSQDWYAVVYEVREVLTAGHACVSYIYAEPLEVHTGWQVTAEGDSDEPDAPSHHWHRVVRGQR